MTLDDLLKLVPAATNSVIALFDLIKKCRDESRDPTAEELATLAGERKAAEDAWAATLPKQGRP